MCPEILRDRLHVHHINGRKGWQLHWLFFLQVPVWRQRRPGLVHRRLQMGKKLCHYFACTLCQWTVSGFLHLNIYIKKNKNICFYFLLEWALWRNCLRGKLIPFSYFLEAALQFIWCTVFASIALLLFRFSGLLNPCRFFSSRSCILFVFVQTDIFFFLCISFSAGAY